MQSDNDDNKQKTSGRPWKQMGDIFDQWVAQDYLREDKNHPDTVTVMESFSGFDPYHSALHPYGLGPHSEETFHKIMLKREQLYTETLLPRYSSLTSDEKAMVDWLVVQSDDTRFGRIRIDGTRLTIWDILIDWPHHFGFFDNYKAPLDDKRVRDAIAVWFFERWMKGPSTPLASRMGKTQKDIAKMLPKPLIEIFK